MQKFLTKNKLWEKKYGTWDRGSKFFCRLKFWLWAVVLFDYPSFIRNLQRNNKNNECKLAEYQLIMEIHLKNKKNCKNLFATHLEYINIDIFSVPEKLYFYTIFKRSSIDKIKTHFNIFSYPSDYWTSNVHIDWSQKQFYQAARGWFSSIQRKAT